jgi:PAS domain S-box-containing protein
MSSGSKAKSASTEALLERLNELTANAQQSAPVKQHSERERWLSQIVESGHDGIWIIDAKARTKYANRRMAEMLGCAGEAIERSSFFDFIFAENVEEVLRWQGRSRQGSTENFDFRYRRYDGTVLWAHVSTVPISDESGTFNGVLGIFSDITERKRAEEALRENEIQFRAIFECSAVGQAQVDAATGRIVRVNRRFCEITGYEDSELIGMSPADLTHLDDRAWDSQGLARLLHGELAEYVREKRHIRKDRQVIWVRVAAKLIRGSTGEPLRTIAVIEDITERKRAEEALVQLASIVTSSPDAIISCTPDARIVTWNHAAERLFGWGPGEVIGQTVAILVPPERSHEWEASFRKINQSESVAQYETVRLRKDHSLIDVSVTLSPVIVDGKMVAVSAIFRDISERKRLEQEVQNYVEQLQAADRRKDDFIATLAHELKNPLAPIRYAGEMLGLCEPGDSDFQWGRRVIDRQVSQLTRLIDDLLDVSRITRNKLALKKQRVLLTDIINSAVDAVRPVINQNWHRFSATLPEESLYLDADAVRLTQVFINIVNNAAKYTPQGGRIRLSAKREDDKVIVRISDNGIGIDAEHLAHLFDMFYQADRSFEQATGGLGIGLTLVKRLVEMHGGTVEVHSAGKNQGSEVTVCLPVLVEPTPVSKSVERAEGKSTVPRRILVVDDYPNAAESLARWLRRVGNEVRTALDGIEGIQIAEQFRPDIVLLDIGMPKLGGYETAERIREQPWGERMVLVALTGWAQEEDQQRTRKSGFDAQLVKPIDRTELAALLAKFDAAWSTDER